MAKQKVTEKILADAKQEAVEILSKFRIKASEIKKSQDKKIAAQKSQIENDSDAAKKIEYLRRISQKKLELNQKLVSEKRKLIEQVIEEALKELPARKEYLDFLKALIKKSGRENGELVVSKSDWKRYGSSLTKFLKNQKYKFNITENNEISGGVMIKKDKIMYHGSLDLIRELMNDQLTIAVSKAFD